MSWAPFIRMLASREAFRKRRKAYCVESAGRSQELHIIAVLSMRTHMRPCGRYAWKSSAFSRPHVAPVASVLQGVPQAASVRQDVIVSTPPEVVVH